MKSEPKKTGPACPECGSREVALCAFASSIKDVRPIGVTWRETHQAPDGSVVLKKVGNVTYRWRCEVCGKKFTAPYMTDTN